MKRFTTMTLLMLASGSALAAQGASTASPSALTTWTLRDWSRVEIWRFFEPPAGGGNNKYAFGANRLLAGVQHNGVKYDVTAALQYVHFVGLPGNAVGPGPLGVGAVYYAHAGRSDSHQVYLRYANIRLKRVVPAVVVQIGRMPYSIGRRSRLGC